MKIQSYIQTGIVEAYVLGLTSDTEKQQFERLLPVYPELQQALFVFEQAIEQLAFDHEVPPPPEIKQRLENFTKGLPVTRYRREKIPPNGGNDNSEPGYIPVYEVSSYITVHKNWRLWFFIFCIMGKITLGLSIYYGVKYYHALETIKRLEQQVPTQAK